MAGNCQNRGYEHFKILNECRFDMTELKQTIHRKEMEKRKRQILDIQSQIQKRHSEISEEVRDQHTEHINTLQRLDDEICKVKIERKKLVLNGVIENQKEQDKEDRINTLRVLKYDTKFISGKLERLELLISKQTTESRSFVTFAIDYLRRKCDVILMNISSQRTLTNIGNLVMETIEKLGELDVSNDVFLSFLDVFTADNFQSIEERQLVLQKCKDVQNHWQTIITDLNKL